MKDKSMFISSIIFFILYLLFLVIIFTSINKVFAPFIIMVALIYFLSPLVNLLMKFKINAVIATTIIYIAFAGIISFCIIFAVPKIYKALLQISDVLTEYAGNLNLMEMTYKFLSGSANNVYNTLIGTVKGSIVILVGVVAAFYILIERESIKEVIDEFIPLKLKPSFKILSDDIKHQLDSFFKGQILIAGILFAIEALFLYIVGVPYALGLGFIAAVLDIIPYVGAFVASGLILLVTIISSPEKLIIVFIGLLLIQQIENSVITPKVSADTMRLHPAITVLVLYVGAFGGFWGILLAIPLACIFRKIAQRFIHSIM